MGKKYACRFFPKSPKPKSLKKFQEGDGPTSDFARPSKYRLVRVVVKKAMPPLSCIALVAAAVTGVASAFGPAQPLLRTRQSVFNGAPIAVPMRPTCPGVRRSVAGLRLPLRGASPTSSDLASLNLTPKLEDIVEGLRSLPDDKFRYKQVLYLAAKAGDMPSELQTKGNKVPGCLSTVYVSATLTEDGRLMLQGDSDAQLTKGLVTLLVNGLSGYKPSEIQAVQSEFITFCGLGASLTPGRNNGFMNMLNVIKRKALELTGEVPSGNAQDGATGATPSGMNEAAFVAEVPSAAGAGKSMYDSVMAKTKVLKPVRVSLTEVTGENEDERPQRFNLVVVADCFDGMAEDKRLQLVATVMRKEASKAALQVTALTPEEDSA